jgi:hypothetical protein
MSTGKKVLLGAGVAAVAVGGLFAARYAYNKHQHSAGKNKLLSAQEHAGSRDVSASEIGGVAPALAPVLAQAKDVEWNNTTQPITMPDSVAVGLGWDGDYKINLDLLGAVYDGYGQLLGCLAGNYNLSLFNNAIFHSGDDTSGGQSGKFANAFGDNENIIIDFRKLPPEALTIVIGVQLMQPVQQLARTYVHMIPLFHEDELPQTAVQGSRAVSYDEDDSSDDEDEDNEADAKKADREQFVRLFNLDLENQPHFTSCGGIIPGKFVKNYQTGHWFFNPLRQIVQVDATAGLWPWMEQFKAPY